MPEKVWGCWWFEREVYKELDFQKFKQTCDRHNIWSVKGVEWFREQGGEGEAPEGCPDDTDAWAMKLFSKCWHDIHFKQTKALYEEHPPIAKFHNQFT